MNTNAGRTRNFRRRIAIERETLIDANKLSEANQLQKLLGLTDAAIRSWIQALAVVLPADQLREVDRTVRELSRATGLLSDESRCAVAEGKVSADFPELLKAFKVALFDAEKVSTTAA